jgi:licheninase
MLPTSDRYGDDYWPDNGEIDIMEHVGYAPDTVHATVHTEAYNHTRGTQRGAATYVPDARSAFNVYAVEWTPDSIRGFVNDRPYFTFPNKRRTDPDANWREWPFDHPFHFVLNIAVGGSWGGAEGIDPSIWPQTMRIDYVRVYRPEE